MLNPKCLTRFCSTTVEFNYWDYDREGIEDGHYPNPGMIFGESITYDTYEEALAAAKEHESIGEMGGGHFCTHMYTHSPHDAQATLAQERQWAIEAKAKELAWPHPPLVYDSDDLPF